MDLNKLNITMISAHSCPVGELGAKDTGGMSVYIRELSKELGILGNQVDVYTRIHDPRDPIMEALGPRVRLIHLKAGPEAIISKAEVYSAIPEFIENLEGFWRKKGLHYDIVFSHYWLSGLIGEHLQKKWLIPFIMMYHTLGAVKNAVAIGEAESDQRLISEKELAQCCRRILVPTKKEKQNLIHYYKALPDKIGIAPCGVNLDTFRPLDKASARMKLDLAAEKILLFIGRIDPLKGVDRLLRAMPLLSPLKDLRLIIIGGDENSREEVDKLKQLVRELKIDHLVIFKGMVKQEQLPDYYNAADVCLVPSYYESFGLVALEALACGTPVIATDVGDLSHIILQGKNGYIVPDNTPEKLAEAILLFFSRPTRNRESLRFNRESVTRFNWARIAELITQELHRALDG
ncbi:MAG: glycosyltransferase [Thermodesulfobacteriota bacterium]